MDRIAVYAGSFDPPTNGHLSIIEKGAKLFDRLIVAVGVNPDKHPLFSVQERTNMLEEVTAHIENVQVTHFSNQFLVKYAKSVGAAHIVRGIRSAQDYDAERSMCTVHEDIGSPIEMVLLMPRADLVKISSSMVKGLVGPEGWQQVVTNYVPAPVLKKLVEKRHGKSH